MADDYARHALSQRAAFEATHPAALAAARLFADEPVLRVVDLGAADGVNSYGLIRDLVEERAGRPLLYALVDPPDKRLDRSPPTTCGRPSLNRGRARRHRHPRRRATPVPESPMSARGSTMGRQRPTARPAADTGTSTVVAVAAVVPAWLSR